MISVAESAEQYIVEMLDRAGHSAVELSLEKQGCNGYKYVWRPVSEVKHDHVVSLKDDRSIVFNSDILPYITDSQVIIEKSRFDTKLVIMNPNVAAECGCGESVNFK